MSTQELPIPDFQTGLQGKSFCLTEQDVGSCHQAGLETQRLQGQAEGQSEPQSEPPPRGIWPNSRSVWAAGLHPDSGR